jgi:hypothetical protein
MKHYVGLDDRTGKIECEGVVTSDPHNRCICQIACACMSPESDLRQEQLRRGYGPS